MNDPVAGCLIGALMMGTAAFVLIYVLIPVRRGRHAVIDTRAQSRAGAAWSAWSILVLSTTIADPGLLFAVGAAAMTAGLALLGFARFARVRVWFVINGDPARVESIVVHVLDLLLFNYDRMPGGITILKGTTEVRVRPSGPRSAIITVRTNSPSPRLTLFLAGFRKRLLFEPGGRS